MFLSKSTTPPQTLPLRHPVYLATVVAWLFVLAAYFRWYPKTMGWLSDWWTKPEDPLHDLDPSLRKFLDNEAPQRYRPAREREREPQTYREQLGLVGEQPNAADETKGGAKPSTNPIGKPPPAESAFQDGRYKNIWETYRPQAEIEQAGKSDVDKLKDILDAWKERQASIKEAAMENCADEQFNLHDCMRNGPWSSRMTMCRAENKSLNKCVQMQSKFLRALGFASLYHRTPEETEHLQMHADRLYQRMQEQEKLILEAKEKGEPVPDLPPLMDFLDKEGAKSPEGLPMHLKGPQIVKFEELPQHMQDDIAEKRFKGLEGPRLELEKRAVEEEMGNRRDDSLRLNTYYAQDRKARLKRLARGEERFGDFVKRYLDWKYYPDDDDDDDD